jgi:tetratricopeptide (TPR) repeat protein/tRNA A-37 threonylcarbamoyl transferase component Bud32
MPPSDPLRTEDHVPASIPATGDSTAATTAGQLSDTGPVEADSQAVQPAASMAGYVIEAELGRGGMGVVYKARHIALSRTAAIKMVLGDLRPNSHGLIRFLAEAGAVAAVRHPHVVGVYDFGDADGRPFLALEYCPGGTLAGRLRAGGRLAPAAAAVLVQKIAAGVGAAHDLGIIHRDLKPGNILFDDSGEPKVSDFGLAKRPGGVELTQDQAVMGTPAYMSPEQAQGGTKFVGPTADVWALGVILYECLTGRRPFEAEDSWGLLQRMMNEEPAGLRTLVREVPGDLDLICRKCLAKAPHERYSTGTELAEDLKRWQSGRPITARPAGLIERGSKWMRRNKPAVAVMAALILGASVSSWQAVRANSAAENARLAEGTAQEEKKNALTREHEERQAKLREKKSREVAQEVARFMQVVFAGERARGNAGRNRVANNKRTVMEAMDQAARTIDGRFGDRPEVEAAVRTTIGQTYYELGAYDEAFPQLRRALELRTTVLGPEHPDTLESQNNLAELLRATGDRAAAEPIFRRVLADMERILGPDDFRTLQAANNLGAMLFDGSDFPAAGALYRRALAGLEKSPGPVDPVTLQVVHNLAILSRVTDDLAEAEALHRRALAGREQTYGPDHAETLQSVEGLAHVLHERGDRAGAEPLFRRALNGYEKALGPDHPDTLSCVNSLGTILSEKGDRTSAGRLLRRALAGREAALGPEHADTLTSVLNLGIVLRDERDFQAAEPLILRAVAGREKVLGNGHHETLVAVNALALLLHARGDRAAAEPHLRRVLAGREALHGPDHRDVYASAHNLAHCLLANGKLAEAEPLLRRALAGIESIRGADHLETITMYESMAGLLRDRGDLPGAEAMYRRSLAGHESARGPDHAETLRCANNYASLLWLKGDYTAAGELFNRVLKGREQIYGRDHSITLGSVGNLGSFYLEAGRVADAVPLLERAVRGFGKRPDMARLVPYVRADLGLALLATGKPAEAEPHLIAGHESLARLKSPPGRFFNLLRAVTTGLSQVYEQTNQPEKAQEWRAKAAKLPPEIAPRPRPAPTTTRSSPSSTPTAAGSRPPSSTP